MTQKTVRLLISSAGRRVELMNCFRAAAVRLGLLLTVHGADLAPEWSPACHLADACHTVPPCGSDHFVPELLAICDATDIHIVIPTIDTELLPLASGREEFTEHGVDVVVSSSEALSIAANKLSTARRLAGVVPTPKTYSLPVEPHALSSLGDRFVVKPINGSSSDGLRLGASASDAAAIGAGFIAQEQLYGDEYTVNCFVDQSGRLLSAVPHQRQTVRGGEVSRGRTVRSPILQDAAEKIVQHLPGLRGPFCFQAFVDGGELRGVFEVNARFGGGYPLTDFAGARFAEWILMEHLGMDLPDAPQWLEDITMLRYDQSIFI